MPRSRDLAIFVLTTETDKPIALPDPASHACMWGKYWLIVSLPTLLSSRNQILAGHAIEVSYSPFV
jgi:hypothetical protein